MRELLCGLEISHNLMYLMRRTGSDLLRPGLSTWSQPHKRDYATSPQVVRLCFDETLRESTDSAYAEPADVTRYQEVSE